MIEMGYGSQPSHWKMPPAMPDDALIQVKPYLDEIANRLWSNNAAVMVGAGFSQNAETVGSTTGSLPNWKQLGDLFYRKLHGQSPGEEERYLSLLKLAEQVEAAFGRPALNNLLRSVIPDLRYAPSKLHSELLGLPWKDVLADWQTNEHLPFWEAKRAALMAELGEPAAARPILESSLLGIRKQIGLNPVAEDCTLVSQESVAMLLLYMVERGMTMTQPDSEAGSLLGELSERWNDLTRYKCDPRREMESFTARLRHPATEGSEESTTHHFDLGIVSNTFHFGTDREVVAAYGLLRLLEDLGMPYRMENMLFVGEPVKATLSRAGPHSPHWALVNIARLGDAKATDHLFNREFLAGLGRDDVDGYMQTYLAALERTVSMVGDPDWAEAKTFLTLAETLPEVFSRLCYKCSPAFRERLMDTLCAIYGSSRRGAFADVRRFAHRVFDSMSVQERASAVPSLIDFPVPESLQGLDERRFVNPVLFLKLPASVQAETIAVSEERVDELLEQLAGDAPIREWAATSLAWLNEKGKLDGQQSERLGSLLWRRVDATGAPVVRGFYSFACMTLPHPAEVDPEPRVKEHLRSAVAEQAAGGIQDRVLDELCNSAGIVK